MGMVASGPAAIDFIANGQASGEVASMLLRHKMDEGILRPFIGKDGRSYVTLREGGVGKPRNVLIQNAATLTKDSWIMLDEELLRVQQEEINFWEECVTRVQPLVIRNGMAVPVLQHQTMSDIGPATMSMDGLRKGERDRPVVDLRGVPLPITHKDFSYSARELAVSQESKMPLDLVHPAMAMRQCMELREKMALGTLATYTYNGYPIYGVTNYPYRLTKTITAPTAGGWSPNTTYTQVLDMIQKAVNKFYRGPYLLLASTPFLQYMEQDYTTDGMGKTLRKRIMETGRVLNVQYSDLLSTSAFILVLVQMTSNVIRTVRGMKFKTVSWPSQGGMEMNFKVMGIDVIECRSDYGNNTGIVHGTTA